jgi:Na+/H+ antiporter NhaD/arsenite permease-like protein
MIPLLVIIIFIAGYTAIAFEQSLKLNKAASALLTGVLCWTVYSITGSSTSLMTEQLIFHFGEIAAILFFLLGAMTVVQLIDSHNGFEIITSRIRTKSKRKLLFTITIITFFLSALLDNLTTAIVMTSLAAKLISEREDRLWFAGMIIIAANAGGAWSPLGDVTTTMLWIGGQITPANIIIKTFVPALFVTLVPLLLISVRFKGKYLAESHAGLLNKEAAREGIIMLVAGIGLLIFIPVFKNITHLPPFMGMLFSLGLLWIITTIIHSKKEADSRKKFTVTSALQKIDTPSILFFLGILLSVAALETMGILKNLAAFLDQHLINNHLKGTALGLLSAIVDNVPLVAATQGMYSLSTYPADHSFWEFIALTTGTGGSIIIIGSAAGVAVMGIEKISFGWFMKKFSWLAFLGFAAGILVYILQEALF